MNISSGNYEIFAQGSVITLGDEPVEMIFDEMDTPVTYSINFGNDEEYDRERIEFRKSESNRIEMYFLNFKNNLDDRAPAPINLGCLGEKNLLLSYRIDSMKKTSGKLFHYTWYLEGIEL